MHRLGYKYAMGEGKTREGREREDREQRERERDGR